MKFTGKFFDAWIDLDGYQAALDTAMREIMAQAVMEWLSSRPGRDSFLERRVRGPPS